MIGPTLEQIHSALVAGFNGYKLSNGKFLTATNTNNTTPSGGVYPFLAFSTGSFTMTPWKDFEDQLSWDIPAILTVQGPAEDGEISARSIVMDLILRTKHIIGLPIDDKGKLTPFGPKTVKLYDDGKLSFLADRGAPFIKSVRFNPVDDGLCRIDLVFHIEATVSLDDRQLKLMEVGVIGIVPVPVGQVIQDQTLPDDKGVLRVFGTAVEAGYGGYADTQGVVGLKPSEIITQLRVTPYAAAISVGTPTAQLQAIVQYQNYASNYVTQQAAWTSSDPTVATVSSAGLVTRVASGSCSISCVFGGVTSNATVVTSA